MRKTFEKEGRGEEVDRWRWRRRRLGVGISVIMSVCQM